MQVRELSAGSGAGGSETPQITSALGSAEGAAIAAATLKQRQACFEAAALTCQAKKGRCAHEPTSAQSACAKSAGAPARNAFSPKVSTAEPHDSLSRMLLERKWFTAGCLRGAWERAARVRRKGLGARGVQDGQADQAESLPEQQSPEEAAALRRRIDAEVAATDLRRQQEMDANEEAHHRLQVPHPSPQLPTRLPIKPSKPAHSC